MTYYEQLSEENKGAFNILVNALVTRELGKKSIRLIASEVGLDGDEVIAEAYSKSIILYEESTSGKWSHTLDLSKN